jgi:Fe-S cluster assembly iron-binding protein IscA
MAKKSITNKGIFIAMCFFITFCYSCSKNSTYKEIIVKLPADLSRAKIWFPEDTLSIKVTYKELPYKGLDTLDFTNELEMKIKILNPSAKEFCLLYGRSFDRGYSDAQFQRKCFPIK